MVSTIAILLIIAAVSLFSVAVAYATLRAAQSEDEPGGPAYGPRLVTRAADAVPDTLFRRAT
jgi:hypothetical protein